MIVFKVAELVDYIFGFYIFFLSIIVDVFILFLLDRLQYTLILVLLQRFLIGLF